MRLSSSPIARKHAHRVAGFALALLFATSGVLTPSPCAYAEPVALTSAQAAAQQRYDKAVAAFKAVLKERRAQIETGARLPTRPGQALYLARINMMSAYKDLTDAVPSRIGRPNKFEIPPAYFDADTEPLIDEYVALFARMQAPPAFAQASPTPFKDVVDLATAIALAKGLDQRTADLAGRIALGLFFAETNGNQNIGNARSNTYKGSFQTGVKEDRNGARKWAALLPKIKKVAPDVAAQDAVETRRAQGIDQRYNHWTAVRNGLMNAHDDLFKEIPEIVQVLPDPVDQMKLFELIQIVPSPTRKALRSGDLTGYTITSPQIMKYLRNNSVFTFGKGDRARTSANYREILDAMWLFDEKFDRALAEYAAIKGGTVPRPR